jgi:carbamoyltransferase
VSRILGISAYYHDSAAALIEGGEIIAAAQEERFTRAKHTADFPSRAVEYCLSEANLAVDELDHVVFYDKPLLKFERLLDTYIAHAPSGFASFKMAMPVWIKEKLYLKRTIRGELAALGEAGKTDILFAEHHQSHAASAFYPSPFEEAAILTMDGVGEWVTTSMGSGHGNQLNIDQVIRWPHSLGLLYTAFTYYVGFKVNSGEYKLMGLAPYGVPRYRDRILKELIDLKPDGSFRLNAKYFNYATGQRMISREFEVLFGGPARDPRDEITERETDLAASIQAVTEEVVLRVTRTLAKRTGLRKLCLGGGVALNCVANGKILCDDAFDEIWVQPSPGDAGAALGAALAAHYQHNNAPRPPPKTDTMQGALLGPRFSQANVESVLSSIRARYQVEEDEQLINTVVDALNDGKIVGWFQGRMEFGPRALGARSILADPRRPEMQRTLNHKIKFREGFRPFAPVVLSESAADWFELDCPSPYMSFVVPVKSAAVKGNGENSALGDLSHVETELPAITHVDGTARVQTVHHQTNPRFHDLLKAFDQKTGCPILVNTSFNVRGEPIVCTPEDAFRCFMKTDIDILVVENCILLKANQDPAFKTRTSIDPFVD